MIITKLQDGLGNQMFQYALGRRMAEKNGTELKLDISEYSYPNKNKTPRSYSLGCFNVIENFADRNDIKAFRANNFNGESALSRAAKRVFRKLQNNKPIKGRNYIAESVFGFQAEILKNENKNIYLYGSWQDENYFRDIESIIRREFTLKNGFESVASEIAEKIKNSPSVSVHIRRGDYKTNPKTKARLGTLSKEYYSRAINLITEKIPSLRFFVFSDDVDWAKREIKTKHQIEFVSGAGINDCEELTLMSLCEHNIIANSSFSWWGAWLNRNPEKIVIAPKKWFADPKKTKDNPCPTNWIKV